MLIAMTEKRSYTPTYDKSYGYLISIKSKSISVIRTNSRKPSSLEETGKECMEAEHKMKMNLLEDEHNQKLLFT
jgi:hypothetical protein